MRRSRWARLITGIWALWFAAILAEPAPLMAVLMSATMGHAPSGVVTNGAQSMADMPGMPGDAAAHRHAPVDPPCMHLGACCCAPVLTTPLDPAPRIPAAPIRLVRCSVPLNVASTPPSTPAHSRPFAIGPPSLVTLV